MSLELEDPSSFLKSLAQVVIELTDQFGYQRVYRVLHNESPKKSHPDQPRG
jgi:hypothetical protein